MSSVDSWDPSQIGLTDRHRKILNRISVTLDAGRLELSDEDQAVLRPAMHLGDDDWSTFVSSEPTEVLVTWVKALTLVERDFSGFECGGKSPVLKLIKVLKTRQALPDDLFGWIRSHTTNKFLPYGSLADRL